MLRNAALKIFIRSLVVGVFPLLVASPWALLAQQPADTLPLRLRCRLGVGDMGGMDATALAISPDSRLIATASYLLNDTASGPVRVQLTKDKRTIGEVRLWDAQTGALVRSLTVDNDKIASLAFSPDGHFLAAGGGNVQLPHQSIRITMWDLRSGQVIRTLDGYDEDVVSLAFLGDSDGLVAVGYPKLPSPGPINDSVLRGVGMVVKTWNARDSAWGRTMTWPLTTRFSFGRDTAEGLVFAVSSYIDGPWDGDIRQPGHATIELRNVKDTAKTATRAGGNMPFSQVSLSSNGRVAAGGNARAVEAWGLQNGVHFSLTSNPTELFEQIALSPDGASLVVVSGIPRRPGGQAPWRVRVWDVASHAVLGTVSEKDGSPDVIDAVMFSPDGSYLVTGGPGGSTEVWDLQHKAGK